jgi:hypothetical protein
MAITPHIFTFSFSTTMASTATKLILGRNAVIGTSYNKNCGKALFRRASEEETLEFVQNLRSFRSRIKT